MQYINPWSLGRHTFGDFWGHCWCHIYTRRKRREVLEEEEEVKDRVANMLLKAERNFKRLQ